MNAMFGEYRREGFDKGSREGERRRKRERKRGIAVETRKKGG